MSRSISKKRRFEILKRDRFTCQYCGRKAPDVVLNVDHVLAVALGGQNEDSNLLTSCQDCNGGKGARALEMADAPIVLDGKARMERLEQAEEYRRALVAERERVDSLLDDIYECWGIADGQDVSSDKWMIPIRLESSCKTFLKHLNSEEIKDCVKIAFSRMRFYSSNKKFRYFCGCCWGAIRRKQNPQA